MRKWAVLLWGPVLFLAGVLGQCVFATTWTILDGGRVYSSTGFLREPEAILRAAGVELSSVAAYTREAETITVHRNPRVTVVYHGQQIETEIQGETAGELLEKLGLSLDVNDRLSVPEETVLEGGMTFRVDRVLQREERRTQVEPYEVITYYASYLPEGDRVVLTKGRDGELLLSEFVCYVNSIETQRELLEQTRTLAPRAEIQALGTGGVTGPGITQEPIIGDGVILLPTGEKLDYNRVDYVRATAYTHSDPGCTSTTATGTKVHHGTVAVDPRYIPYGTRMFIMASDGSYIYGLCEAEDCGGDIKGDRVDLYLPNTEACMEFGRRRCTVYFLG